MNVPPNDSLFWPFARTAFLVICLGLCLYFNYKTFDPQKDPASMIIMAVCSGLFDFGKRQMTSPPTSGGGVS